MRARTGLVPAVLLTVAAGLLGPAPAEAQRFREVADEAGVEHVSFDRHRIAGAAAWLDYDGDGWEDLYLTGGELPDRLFRNLGDGTFEDVTEAAGLDVLEDTWTEGVVSGDVDGDGDRDLFVTTFHEDRNYLLRNEGDGTFTDVTLEAGLTDEPTWSTAAAFGDVDLDGDLDLYVGNYATYDGLPYDENLTGGRPNFLYLNQGDGTFVDRGRELDVWDPNGPALAVTFTDYDADGDPDIYVANDFGFVFEPNRLYRNEYPELAFTEVAEETGIDFEMNGMGIAVGDPDRDGDLDMYITNMGNNAFVVNRGDGVYDEMGVELGLNNRYSTSWGTVFFDADNDGGLDLIWANGRVLPSYDLENYDRVKRLFLPHADRLFRFSGGDGELAFADVSENAAVADTVRGRGLAVADYDQDGDLDVAVAVNNHLDELENPARLYRNETENGAHWIQVALEGRAANRDAFGSLVEVWAGGKRWTEETRSGGSYMSQSSSVVHVGLGEVAAVDSVVVRWPGGGRQVVRAPAVDQRIRIVQEEGGGS